MSALESFERRNCGLFRIIGYALLVLSLFDYISVFIPPKFLDPVWEFQTMANLVERVPVPCLGLMLVFYGENLFREKIEKPFLKLLSWAALIVGVLFILLIPLGIRDSLRIDTNNEATIRYQANQQMSRSQQVEQVLNQATTPEQIANALTALNNQRNLPPQIKQDPEKAKNQILSNIGNAKKRLQEQSEGAMKSRRQALIKQTIKINLGALVSGCLFIYLWRISSWARRRKLRGPAKG